MNWKLEVFGEATYLTDTVTGHSWLIDEEGGTVRLVEQSRARVFLFSEGDPMLDGGCAVTVEDGKQVGEPFYIPRLNPDGSTTHISDIDPDTGEECNPHLIDRS